MLLTSLLLDEFSFPGKSYYFHKSASSGECDVIDESFSLCKSFSLAKSFSLVKSFLGESSFRDESASR